MRVARPLVPVLIALLACLCAASPAFAAQRSGTLPDPAGDVASSDGYARPDVAQFSVAHDPATGSLVTTVRFHAPVPARQAGRDTAFRIVYNTGRAAAEGYCEWTHTGDLGVRIDVVRTTGGDYITQTATPRPSGPDILDNNKGSFSGDGTTLTLTTTHTQFRDRDYTCVSPTRVTYEGLTGADEVAGFFFDGFAPPPAAPDGEVPSIRWESPASGATISGTYSEGGQNGSKTCRMSAGDNVRVNRIEIFVDNVPTEIQRFAPWGCEIDTRALPDGQHVLRAVAYDEAGNTAETAIQVTVKNAGVAPPPAPAPVVIPPNTPVVAPTPVVPVTPVTQVVPVVPIGGTSGASVSTPVALTPSVDSRLEPFMRCRVSPTRKVRACRVQSAAFLSVRVTDAIGTKRRDVSGRVRVKITCRPSARCDGRVMRLRTARPTLISLLGGRVLPVGTVVELRLTRPGAIGSFHRLVITRDGPRTRACRLQGGRPRSCE